MGGADLRAEMLAFGVDYRACQRLQALGVSGRFVATLGARIAIGQARVLLQDGGRFWEPRGPDGRLLLGCYENGVLIDIAAVSTASPDQVAMRTGLGWCLGADQIEDAHRASLAERRSRLRIVADPIEWLRAEGNAICVFDWQAALPELRLLGERVTIECDAGAGDRLRARLRIGGLPKVSERAPERVAA